MKKLSRKEFVLAWKQIRLFAIDVDGVLTDDSIYVGPDALELKRFNISDGFFMVLAMRAGLEIAIVSGRHSPATDSRMRELGVKHILQGKRDKVAMITPLLEQADIAFSEVAFIGNELLDISLAEKVGLPIAVADSCDGLRVKTAYETAKQGGRGAVREILECYFEAVEIDPRSLL